VEAYRTEEEQVEALRRWWNENGRSTLVAIILALGVGFGYQAWKGHEKGQEEGASDLYQRMLQAFSAPALSPEQLDIALQLAVQLKADYPGSTYGQFAALQLARVAVGKNDLAEAQAELRWVLGNADKGSDVERIAQLRLARVVAAAGDPEQALSILDQADAGPYQASYALARGDILLGMSRVKDASDAYSAALALAREGNNDVDLVAVEQKLQAINPRAARAEIPAPAVSGSAEEPAAPAVDSAAPAADAGTGQEE
jgi:predicted negative regulator of RcsB-dependent stress response